MGLVTFNIPDFRQGVKNAFAEIKIDVYDLASTYGMKTLFKALRSDYDTDDPIGRSYLGTPVLSNLIFGRVTDPNNTDMMDSDVEKNYYIDLKGNRIQYSPLRIDTCLMTIKRQKRIITTALQGRDGTIKEYVGADDYEITVDGSINIGGHVYPEYAVRALEAICNIPDQIPVTSKFLDLFGIDYAVITSFEFKEERGVRNQQSFTITMLSDESPEDESSQSIDYTYLR